MTYESPSPEAPPGGATHAVPAAAGRHPAAPDDPTHSLLLHAVGELEALVERLESDGADHWCRTRAAMLIETLGATARHHHQVEERTVFPALARLGDPALDQVLSRLREDHGWLEENWLELLAHLQPVAEGFGGWDIDLLRHASGIYVALMREHVQLEEQQVVPLWLDLSSAAAHEAELPAVSARPVAALLRGNAGLGSLG